MATTNVLRDNVFAVMPRKVINKISGEPTYSAIRTRFKQIFTNLISFETPKDWGRGKGHLVMLQAPAIFYACNGNFYNPHPNASPAYSNILPSANTAKHERLRA